MLQTLEQLFCRTAYMSLYAAAVTLVVLATRLALRRAPHRLSYILWSAVAFRLCVPVSVRSVFSIFNLSFLRRAEDTAGTAPAVLPDGAAAPAVISSADAAQLPAAAVVTANAAPPSAPAAHSFTLLTAAALVWAVGALALLAALVLSFVRQRRAVATAVRVGGGKAPVYASENVRSPFVLGIFRPVVYIPYGLTPPELRCIVMHERCHIRRGDHIVRLGAAVLCAVHWMNPLVWLGRRLMCRDMEMSCDEYVAERTGARRQYSLSLLSIAANRKSWSFLEPAGFGGSDVKERIQNVLSYKRPPRGILAAAVIMIILIMAACVTDPAQSIPQTSPVSAADDVTSRVDAPADDAAKISAPDVLAEYSTEYDPANAERAQNIARACEYINNTVLAAGDVFSFNAAVGERTAERGFAGAAVAPFEPTVEEYGGGICQAASTLFYCAMMADLELVERHNHTYTPNYMTDRNGTETCGIDAMVVWGAEDLRFRNDREQPMIIECSCGGGCVTFRIMGTWNGRCAEYRCAERSAEAYGTVYRRRQEGCVNTPGMIGRTMEVYRVEYAQERPDSAEREELEMRPEYRAVYKPLARVEYVDAPPEGCEFEEVTFVE